MTTSLLVFITLAIIAIAAAIGLIVNRNTVYSALFLIINFLAVAVIYLIMGAPFIALAQITVYAGAIMVLFLFVIMLLGADKTREKEQMKWQRPLAIVLGGAVLIEGVYALITHIYVDYTTFPAAANLADPKTLGLALYTKYSLPFETTSVILLVAAIGAVVLTKRLTKEKGQ
jgi:NADH-quinone oxidoreductase subunit J